jgi:hypothetical protein
MPPSSSLSSSKRSGTGSAAYLLFLTHHLLSATKQAQLRTWAKDLSLVGLAKRGYPGVILLLAASSPSPSTGVPNGSSQKEWESMDRLEEVGRRIKRMQWASQDLRPVQAVRSSTFANLQRVLAERQGVEAGTEQQGTANATSAAAKGIKRLPPLLFLDSMKEISALFHEADQLNLLAEGGGGKAEQAAKGSSSPRVSQELWRDIWRREMKPR